MQVTRVTLMSFLDCTLILCHIKENVSCENYGDAFWQCDNRCHPKSPKMRSPFKSHKASLTQFEEPSDFEGLWHFLPLWPPLGIDPHQDVLLCFWIQLSHSSSLMTVKRNIDSPQSCYKKNKKQNKEKHRQGWEYVNNLKKKTEESIFKWLLLLIYN